MNIHLPLHPSVTKDECGECDYASNTLRWDDAGAPICTRPEFAVNGESPIREDEKRLPACLAAASEAERVERDARLGKAVREAGDTLAWAIDLAIDAMREGSGFGADEPARLRGLRAALREEAAESALARAMEAMPSEDGSVVLWSLYEAAREHATQGGRQRTTNAAERQLADARAVLTRLDAFRSGQHQPTETDMENARKSGSPFLSGKATEPGTCAECEGSGYVTWADRCTACNGTGRAKGDA